MNSAAVDLPIEYQPYDALLRGQKIGFPQCKNCGKFHWFPRPSCPHCASSELVWKVAPRIGTLYTWTVVRRKLDPDFPGEAPYTVGMVEFDGFAGVRLVTNIVDTPFGSLMAGLAVEPVFTTTPEGQPIVHFKGMAQPD
jgi:uncharacterized protein